MNIGLFFGSFNPIHVGHLIIANTMVENTNLQEVWFVVSPQNPFKKRKDLLHEFDRYDMVNQAIADNPNLRVSDIEFNMPKPSYTIDTLVRLSEKYPQYHFGLIMGGDNLKHLPKWKNYEQILANYQVYVYPRPNQKADETLQNHPKVQQVEAPLLDISATFIRRLVQQNKSIRYLVHEAVVDHIRIKKFYQ